MVTEPAVARAKERKEEAEGKQDRAAGEWLELLASAKQIESERLEQPYDDLSAAQLKILVSFVFKAKKEKGLAEHAAPKAKAVAFLSGLTPGEMQQLLCRTQPGVPATLLLVGPVVTATRATRSTGQVLLLK